MQAKLRKQIRQLRTLGFDRDQMVLVLSPPAYKKLAKDGIFLISEGHWEGVRLEIAKYPLVLAYVWAPYHSYDLRQYPDGMVKILVNNADHRILDMPRLVAPSGDILHFSPEQTKGVGPGRINITGTLVAIAPIA